MIWNVTRGRKKRKRSPRAGTGVNVSPHIRTPRGPNARKPRVKVDGYKRGKPAKASKRRSKK